MLALLFWFISGANIQSTTDQRHRGGDGQDAEEQSDQLSFGTIEGEVGKAETRAVDAVVEWGWWRL